MTLRLLLLLVLVPLVSRAQQSDWGHAASVLGDNGLYRPCSLPNGEVWLALTLGDTAYYRGQTLVPSTRLRANTTRFQRTDIWLARIGRNGRLRRLVQPALLHNGAYVSRTDCDAAGNVYLTGGYYGRFTLGGDTLAAPPAGSSNSFLCKLDTAGNVLWTRALGPAVDLLTGQPNRITDYLRLDAQGNVYLAGPYRTAMSIGSTAFPDPGSVNVFVAKYTTDGQFEWANSFGGFSTDLIEGFAVGPAGDCVLGINFTVSTQIGTQTYNFGGRSTAADVLLAMLRPDGSVAWVKGGGRPSERDYVPLLTVQPSGDVVAVVGVGTGTAFGGLAMPASYSLLRLARATGQQQSARAWVAGLEFVRGRSDAAGNLYVTKENRVALALGNGVSVPAPTNGNAVPLCVMLTPEGVPQWAVQGQTVNPAQPLSERRADPYDVLVGRDGTLCVHGEGSSGFALGNDTIRTPQYARMPNSAFVWKITPPLAVPLPEASPLRACPGATFTVPYAALSSLPAGTGFTAQLSDSLGSFATPVVLGNATGAGSITATVPPGTPPGRYYQLRVVTAAPNAVVSVNALALRIQNGAYATLTGTPSAVVVCTGAPGLTLRGSGSAGAALQWLRNGQAIPGATTATYTPAQSGQYALQVSSNCGTATSAAVAYTVAPLPAVTHVALPPVDLSTAPFALTGGTPAGGTYSGPGVTSNTFTPRQAGVGVHTLQYRYRDAQGCEGTAALTLEVRTSLAAHSALRSALALFPNPARTSVTLRLAPGAARTGLQLTLLDATGRTVLRQPLTNATEVEVELGPQPTGLYLVRVDGPNGYTAQQRLALE